jgi:hypothetical protein
MLARRQRFRLLAREWAATSCGCEFRLRPKERMIRANQPQRLCHGQADEKDGLAAAGAADVSVIATRYNGMIHDFVLLNGIQTAPEPQAAIRQMSAEIKAHLAPSETALTWVAIDLKADTSFFPVKDSSSRRWHARTACGEFEILTTGSKRYDTRAKRGGGGAVDLVMHLCGLHAPRRGACHDPFDRFHREGKEPWLNDHGLIVRARRPHGSRTPWTY